MDVPDAHPVIYEPLPAAQGATFWRNLAQAESFSSSGAPLAMELFPVNKNRGQAYGYALYQPQVILSGGEFTVDGLDMAINGRANIFVNHDNQVS